MVAAWIRADTGVGPSMASGSQVCRKNWADLPMAPDEQEQAGDVRARASRRRRRPTLASTTRRRGNTSANSMEPNIQNTVMMPRTKPKSPTRLTMKALLAAAPGGVLVEPEADQQVAGETHAFPAEEQLHEVRRRHQREHGEGEEER
jgi:hypothetical protein